MIEQVSNRRNMRLAYQQVVRNKIVQLAETDAMQTDLKLDIFFGKKDAAAVAYERKKYFK